MKNYKIFFLGLISLLFFGLGFIWWNTDQTTKNVIPASSIGDGDYYVQITHQNGDNFVFKHITYFIGTDAYKSAEKEIKCEKTDITECVPTLIHGYYIRTTSPASDFVKPIEDAKIFLANDKSISASKSDLIAEISLPDYVSAFKIRISKEKIETVEELTRYNNSVKFSLPKGYTLDSYQIEKNLDVSCKLDNNCETPGEYLVKSNCPYTSLCLKNSCNVVCPDFK